MQKPRLILLGDTNHITAAVEASDHERTKDCKKLYVFKFKIIKRSPNKAILTKKEDWKNNSVYASPFQCDNFIINSYSIFYF